MKKNIKIMKIQYPEISGLKKLDSLGCARCECIPTTYSFPDYGEDYDGKIIESERYAKIFDTDFYWEVPYIFDYDKYTKFCEDNGLNYNKSIGFGKRHEISAKFKFQLVYEKDLGSYLVTSTFVIQLQDNIFKCINLNNWVSKIYNEPGDDRSAFLESYKKNLLYPKDYNSCLTVEGEPEEAMNFVSKILKTCVIGVDYSSLQNIIEEKNSNIAKENAELKQLEIINKGA